MRELVYEISSDNTVTEVTIEKETISEGEEMTIKPTKTKSA